MIRSALFLALRYLASAPGRTATLIAGTTVALALPVFTGLAADRLERGLMARAESSPILIGHVGDEFDLVMSALYFRGEIRDPLLAGARREASAYGLAVPLYVAHSASGIPVVGTSLEYLEARDLQIAAGRTFALLGEVVAGAGAAEAFHLGVGDTVRSDLTNLYNLAGAYPVLLEVVGVLAPSGGPDDDAFFTDVKTIWVLDGDLHGHEAITRTEALNPDAPEGEALEASLAVFTFTELTDRTVDDFHLHGDPDTRPIGAVMVFPDDDRRRDQLLGDYALKELQEAVRPTDVIQAILGIVLQIREGLALYFAAVAASTLAFFGLVITLSLRLRRSELDLMRRIGSAPSAVAWIVGAEIALVVGASVIAATALNAAGLWALDALL